MKKWGKALVAACVASVAGFIGAGNAYADAYTVKIDDPDFYAALKDCVQNGMEHVMVSNSDVVQVLKILAAIQESLETGVVVKL